MWNYASENYSTRTDFKENFVCLEVQIYFPSGEFSSTGLAVRANFLLDEEIWIQKLQSLLQMACMGEEPAAGCFGVVSTGLDLLARPCLTLLVSGPDGGVQTAENVRYELAKPGINIGVIFRSIKDYSVGILKIPFLPELYVMAQAKGYGIDWLTWNSFFLNDKEFEWGSACLLWCDQLISAIQGLRETLSLVIDDCYYDFMKIVPLNRLPTDKLFADEEYINDLIKSSPYDFLFG